MSEIQPHLAPLWEKIDAHAQRLSELKSTSDVFDHRVARLELDHKSLGEQLAGYMSEMMASINVWQNESRAQLAALISAQAEEKGAKAANNRVLYLISLIPAIILIFSHWK